MGCYGGTQCKYLCGEACSTGGGAICGLESMNSSESFLAACSRVSSFTPETDFVFAGWASERPPDDWNGNVTHGPYNFTETSPFANSSGCDHHLECTYWTDYYKAVMTEARRAVSAGTLPDFMGNHMALFNDPWLTYLCDWAASEDDI
eukprot:FR739066.1.p1 GENE.FR739066.1~~FR739066.1.p1  ORF type:complete len:163 (+),score=5.76 FR739066.1:47-490(+)